MQVFDKRERAALLKKTKSAFASAGWKCSDVSVKDFDFNCQKSGITLFIQCIDSSVRKFRSVESISIYMERAKNSFKDFGAPSIFILGEKYDFCDFSVFWGDGVIALLESDLDLVVHIDNYMVVPTNTMIDAERLIVSRSQVLATSISRWHEEHGDIPAATHWAELAAKAAPRSLGLQQRCIQLLRQSERFSDAFDLGREALFIHPDAPRLIKMMIELARERQDANQEQFWVKRLALIPEAAYKLPQLSGGSLNPAGTSSSAKSQSNTKGVLPKFIKDLFKARR